MTFDDLSEQEQRNYADLDAISKQAELIKDGTVIRFKPNRAILFAQSRVNLNDMWVEAQRNDWPTEDLKLFYRGMGYSLCGFLDIFPSLSRLTG